MLQCQAFPKCRVSTESIKFCEFSKFLLHNINLFLDYFCQGFTKAFRVGTNLERVKNIWAHQQDIGRLVMSFSSGIIASPDPFCTRYFTFSRFLNCNSFSVAINWYLIWFEDSDSHCDRNLLWLFHLKIYSLLAIRSQAALTWCRLLLLLLRKRMRYERN